MRDIGKQFRVMVEYGMTPLEAIQAATRNGAQALGPGKGCGRDRGRPFCRYHRGRRRSA
jgi:imidazolonepropionase-like amidohydrolase